VWPPSPIARPLVRPLDSGPLAKPPFGTIDRAISHTSARHSPHALRNAVWKNCVLRVFSARAFLHSQDPGADYQPGRGIAIIQTYLWNSGEAIMKIDGRCHCGYVTFEVEAIPKRQPLQLHRLPNHERRPTASCHHHSSRHVRTSVR
jgi:hypothetical protein